CCAGDSGALHSFPTRRSSDLVTGASDRMPTSSPIHTWFPSERRQGNEMFTFERITTPLPARAPNRRSQNTRTRDGHGHGFWKNRSEEHTSELQSRENIVCRLL